MKVAVVSAVYNEEKSIGRLIESLLVQTRMPDEIVLVDDGSKDGTAGVMERYAKQHPVIRMIRNSNQGPAASRNIAWRATKSDITIFTDGDCVPDRDWIEKVLIRFTSEDIGAVPIPINRSAAALILLDFKTKVISAVQVAIQKMKIKTWAEIGAVPTTVNQKKIQVGAVAGAYRTLNDGHVLPRFVGYEVAWRYRKAPAEVDAHGAYNLAVRKSVLEEMNGFEESYKVPSGEDWDLTYRISRKYKILFAPDAVVAHAHPEAFWPYMQNQARRGFDRIKLYNDHPDKRGGDIYTGGIVKYQVLAAGLLPFALFLLLFRGLCVVPLVLFLFLFVSCWNSFAFIFKRDPATAFYGVGVQFARCFAWAWGALKGVLRFGFKLWK